MVSSMVDKKVEEVVGRLIIIESLIKDYRANSVHGTMPKSFYDALKDIELLLDSAEVFS